MFGRGLYFANKASKSDRHIPSELSTSEGPYQGCRAMLVCEVLLGCSLVIEGHLSHDNLKALWDIDKNGPLSTQRVIGVLKMVTR